jgi:hypothetical protein
MASKEKDQDSVIFMRKQLSIKQRRDIFLIIYLAEHPELVHQVFIGGDISLFRKITFPACKPSFPTLLKYMLLFPKDSKGNTTYQVQTSYI